MAANIRHSSETAEHFTPKEIVEATRDLFAGIIELDPATSLLANETVGARKIFTKEDNGLRQTWRGRVFLNPPGGLCDELGQAVIRKSKTDPGCTVSGSCGLPKGHEHKGVTSQAKAWWLKLAQSWQRHDVECAIFVGFSIEILQSTQVGPSLERLRVPLPLDFPFCIPSERIRFLTEKKGELVVGKQPTHASCLVYLPARWDVSAERFRECFSKFGRVRL